MNRLFKYLLLLVFIGSSAALFAQKSKLRDMYQVKKKDTIYGIAKMYGLTVDELVRANPEMTQPDYVLKKGLIYNDSFSSRGSCCSTSKS